MKAIINGKLYDTDKAEKVFSYRRKYAVDYVLKGLKIDVYRDVTIYQTAKGAYFEIEEADDKREVRVLNECQVKGIIEPLDPDKYIELFGEIDEA